jgi:hypothetical protein
MTAIEFVLERPAIGDLCFPTKAAATEFFRKILYRYAVGERVVGEDEVTMLSLLQQCHPRAATKIGCGVQQITVGTAAYGARCFLITRTDGSVDDFSYRKCLYNKGPTGRLRKDQEEEQWWNEYDEYLNTDEWGRRRSLVMNRAGGMCEGCRERRATQVHHLTYKHVKNEFLWELVAICDICHGRIHS